MATTLAIFATAHVSAGAIAKMLSCSDLKDEVQANWIFGVAGDGARRTSQGRPAVHGGAARRHWRQRRRQPRNGIDAGGLPGAPAMAIGNVETYEKEHPILYVYRRAGTGYRRPWPFRGGVGIEAMASCRTATKDRSTSRLKLTARASRRPRASTAVIPQACRSAY